MPQHNDDSSGEFQFPELHKSLIWKLDGDQYKVSLSGFKMFVFNVAFDSVQYHQVLSSSQSSAHGEGTAVLSSLFTKTLMATDLVIPFMEEYPPCFLTI